MGSQKVQDSKRVECKLHWRRVDLSVELSSVSEVFSQRELCSILGGNSCSSGDRRFSIWSAEPAEVFEFNEGEKEPFKQLKAVLGKYRLADKNLEGLPKGIFCCGWIGYFGYY